jgi:hypothetical protein
MKQSQSALGFRIKSGWAAAILLAAPLEAPQVIKRRVVKLSDDAEPQSIQPYHAALETPGAEGAKIVERLRKVVLSAAEQSIKELLTNCHNAGHQVRAAGIVVGSDIDPTRIANDHIRAHALEGRLFRTAVEEALKLHGLRSSIIVERDAYARAAAQLARPEARLKRELTELGRSVGGPWRADEKMATLAAWLALS